jgi:hypothetical protein
MHHLYFSSIVPADALVNLLFYSPGDPKKNALDFYVFPASLLPLTLPSIFSFSFPPNSCQPMNDGTARRVS